MDLNFRLTAYEILDPRYSIDGKILEQIIVASGEKLDYHRQHAMPKPETIVARINNTDIGFAVFDYSVRRPHKWVAVYVDIKYQGYGIGKALYEKITEKIGDYGITVVVKESQTRARKFFEDRGFSEAYISYFSDIDFSQIKSRVESYFTNNRVLDNIKIEEVPGKMHEISQEIKDLVVKYNSLVSSKTENDHIEIVKRELFKSDYVFDCAVIYVIREKNLIVGLITFSMWDSDCPLIDFLYVEPMDSKKDLLIRMILVKKFIYSGHKEYASHVSFSGRSLDLKSVSLLSYLNKELPYGYITYALPSNDK